MTLPDGTVALVAIVTVPSVSPADVIAVVAAACVCPTTFGTVAVLAPVDTTRLTAVFGGTELPAAGDWLITLPAATVELVDVVIVPTVKPAATIAELAFA